MADIRFLCEVTFADYRLTVKGTTFGEELALARKRGDVIEYLDGEHAVIRYCVSAPMKQARRIERRFTPTMSSVVWWKCPRMLEG
jgi:hypothetical protein